MSCACVVDVWVVDLDQVPAATRGLLSEQEHERAAALRDELGQARWSASRAVLRALLGERLDLDPRELAVELGPHGKPRLAEPVGQPCLVGPHGKPRLAGAVDELRLAAAPDGGASDLRGREDLRFSLSHSGPTAIYALCSGREVGVDVERADRRQPADELAVAKRMLGSASERRLSQLPAKERFAQFMREWTAHEARAKCLGIGLGAARDGAAADELQRLWVCELHAGEQAFAALAVEGGPVAVREREWGGS